MRDSGANVVAGMEVGNFPSYPCICHIFDLIADKSINAQISVKQMIAKAKYTANHFRNARLPRETLINIQKQRNIKSPKIPISSCATRWNSEFYMLERLLVLKSFIVEAFDDLNLDEGHNLNSNDWNLLREVKVYLSK